MVVLLDGTVFQYKPSGIAKATLGLYRGCREIDPTLSLVLAHRAPLAPLAAAAGGSRLALPLPVNDDRWRQLAMPFGARLTRPDLVHFPWNGHVPRLLPAGVPVICSVMDVLPLDIPGYFATAADEGRYRRRLGRDLGRADLVLTISEYSRRRILSEIPTRADVVVTPLAVWEEDERGDRVADQAAAANAPERYFLYCGGFDARKRIDLAVSVFCDLWRAGKLRAPLVIAGDVVFYSAEIERLVEAGRALGAVKTVGYVGEGALAALYRRALGLVYPSRFEGFGLPPLEAMAHGCPVITCRETAIPEVCGDAAVYLDPARESESMAEALALLESDEGRRRELAARGRARAAQFSWRKAGQRYLDAVADLRRRGG